MKQYTLWMLCAALLGGCGKAKKDKTDASSDRMQHRIEYNQVTVDTLRRRDFQRELISNGRLIASRRSTLSFPSRESSPPSARKNGARVGRAA